MVQIAWVLNYRVRDLAEAAGDRRGRFRIPPMTLPGAVDLLMRYEAMTSESRRLLVELLQNIELPPA